MRLRQPALIVTTIILFLLSANSLFAEIKILPIVNFRLAGGNSYYTGKNQDMTSTPFNRNTDLDIIPVVRLNDRLSLMPRFSTSYSGVNTLYQVEDKEVVYQQTVDQLLSLRLLYKFNSNTKFGTEYGEVKEFTRATKDEKWGAGLYDYRNRFISIEVEKRFSDLRIPFLIGGGFKFYTLRYPNCHNINLSEQPVQVDSLDKDNQEIFLNGDITFGEESLLKWDAVFTRRNFKDKDVFIEWGATSVYVPPRGQDTILEGNTKMNFLLPGQHTKIKTYCGVALGVKNNTSADIFEDAHSSKTIPHFYSFHQQYFAPSVSLKLLPSDFTITLDFELFHRVYPDRIRALPEESGDDFTYGVQATIRSYKAGFYYPLKGGFALDGTVNFRNSSSKAEYQPEKYNYKSFHYLLGFSYEY